VLDPRRERCTQVQGIILPLIFTKRLCDVFDDELNRIAAEIGSRAKAFKLVKQDKKLVRFYLPLEPKNPDDPVWSVIRTLSDRIGEQLTTYLPLDHSMLSDPKTEQQRYPERTGIRPRLERYCPQSRVLRALRDPAPPAPWPRWGFGGAAQRRHQRTEDLDVKVCEEAVTSASTHARDCRKAIAAGNVRPPSPKASRSGL
jgi:HsdM N-terminal domain